MTEDKFDTGIVNRPLLQSGYFQCEQSVQPRAETYFKDMRQGSGGGFQSHVDENMLRFCTRPFYRVIMLIQLRHKQCGASVFRLFYNPFHTR